MCARARVYVGVYMCVVEVHVCGYDKFTPRGLPISKTMIFIDKEKWNAGPNSAPTNESENFSVPRPIYQDWFFFLHFLKVLKSLTCLRMSFLMFKAKSYYRFAGLLAVLHGRMFWTERWQPQPDWRVYFNSPHFYWKTLPLSLPLPPFLSLSLSLTVFSLKLQITWKRKGKEHE